MCTRADVGSDDFDVDRGSLYAAAFLLLACFGRDALRIVFAELHLGRVCRCKISRVPILNSMGASSPLRLKLCCPRFAFFNLRGNLRRELFALSLQAFALLICCAFRRSICLLVGSASPLPGADLPQCSLQLTLDDLVPRLAACCLRAYSFCGIGRTQLCHSPLDLLLGLSALFCSQATGIMPLVIILQHRLHPGLPADSQPSLVLSRSCVLVVLEDFCNTLGDVIRELSLGLFAGLTVSEDNARELLSRRRLAFGEHLFQVLGQHWQGRGDLERLLGPNVQSLIQRSTALLL
mmetsp:Transcript_18689/g.34819  ORF Transcript_18689/g.34819 Transcript_18689/m.34819 type:complete len:293 (-) Transcript_18689:44-922(-)